MASADYRICDNCGRKVFYDAELNYDYENEEHKAKELGEEQDYRIDSLGDWCVLCNECAKTYKTTFILKNRDK